MKNKIAFIAEYGPEIGYGHLYRSLALAKEFLKKGKQVDFVINDKKSKQVIVNSIGDESLKSFAFLEENISDYRYVLIDVFKDSWKNYKKLIAGEYQSKFVSIIDYAFLNYAIETDYIFAIGLQPYNFKEDCLIQEKKVKTKIFSGNDFFIFREEFSKVDPPETKSKVSNIFISMGGSDPLDLTVQAINGLDEADNKLNLKVILGTGYNESRILGLKDLISKSKHCVTLYKDVSNISDLMTECDLAIINGGNTRFELAYLGIPFISLSINKKQKQISDYAEKQGFGISLGVSSEISSSIISDTIKDLSLNFEKRKRMSLKMKKVVNINGAKRIHELLF